VLASSGGAGAPFYGFVDVPTIIDCFFKGALRERCVGAEP
jgi:hypothetical protein